MKIKACNAFNVMFVDTVDTGVCGSYTTPYTEYYEVKNCIYNVDIDSIECIRDPCLVSAVLTYIVLIVWLKSPESQLSKTFCGLKIH